MKRVFYYSTFVRKCTDMCKHHFGVLLLQNPPLCSSTLQSANKATNTTYSLTSLLFAFFGVADRGLPILVRPIREERIPTTGKKFVPCIKLLYTWAITGRMLLAPEREERLRARGRYREYPACVRLQLEK
jgi:hypothetical protein